VGSSKWSVRLLSAFCVLVFGVMGFVGVKTKFGDQVVHRQPGVLVAQEPVQVPSAPSVRQLKGFTLASSNPFRITARVLSKKRYRFKETSDLMPVDVALGWGPMSDSAVLDKLHIWQSGRWYFWQSKGALPVDAGAISSSSANMHLIPADDAVEAAIDRMREGDLVTLTGELVDVAGKGMTMATSTTRTDAGAGACEIILVRSATIAPVPPA
jgi:hypothetical protein